MIRLRRQTVYFDPPLRVQMVIITRRYDGFVFKAVPADSVEADNLKLVARGTGTSEEVLSVAEVTRSHLKGVAAGFPFLAELNLTNLPDAYKLVPRDVLPGFQFAPGSSYVVAVVSDAVSEANVIAE